MSKNNKNKVSWKYNLLYGVVSISLTVGIGYLLIRAGNIDSPGVPDSAGRMYTLENIYDYLTEVDSAVPTKPTGAFANPSAGPGSTMHTLDDIFSSLTRIPATGQTTSYRTADDGDHETGATLRYTDNGDGTTTDNNTGLMWAQDGDEAGCNNGSTATWDNAIDYCLGLTFATYSDWRLPNVNELFLIVKHDASISAPYIDHTYFPNTQSYYYWSSTTDPDDTDDARNVKFGNGNVDYCSKDDDFYVRCVR